MGQGREKLFTGDDLNEHVGSNRNGFDNAYEKFGLKKEVKWVI